MFLGILALFFGVALAGYLLLQQYRKYAENQLSSADRLKIILDQNIDVACTKAKEASLWVGSKFGKQETGVVDKMKDVVNEHGIRLKNAVTDTSLVAGITGLGTTVVNKAMDCSVLRKQEETGVWGKVKDAIILVGTYLTKIITEACIIIMDIVRGARTKVTMIGSWLVTYGKQEAEVGTKMDNSVGGRVREEIEGDSSRGRGTKGVGGKALTFVEEAVAFIRRSANINIWAKIVLFAVVASAVVIVTYPNPAMAETEDDTSSGVNEVYEDDTSSGVDEVYEEDTGSGIAENVNSTSLDNAENGEEDTAEEADIIKWKIYATVLSLIVLTVWELPRCESGKWVIQVVHDAITSSINIMKDDTNTVKTDVNGADTMLAVDDTATGPVLKEVETSHEVKDEKEDTEKQDEKIMEVESDIEKEENKAKVKSKKETNSKINSVTKKKKI